VSSAGRIETTPAHFERSAPVAPGSSLVAPPSLPVFARRDAAEPTVRVTIGRIDVRALKAEEPAEPPKKPKPAPRMSLDEYLGRPRERAG